MKRICLLVVDVQQDYFPEGRMALPGMSAASEKVARVIRFFRQSAAPVIHIQHIEKDPGAPFFVEGSPGAAIHPSAEPSAGETVIQKHRPNAFLDTELFQELTDKEISKLVICGAMTNMCIDATTRAAADLGFQCVVLADACAARAAGFNDLDVDADQVHAAFLSNLAAAYAAVVQTESFVQEQIN